MPSDLLRAVEDAELAVLGTVLATSGACLDDFVLTGADFYEPKRGDLFDVMLGMRREGKPVEALTLSEANPSESAYLWSLTDYVTSTSSASYYASIVAKHALRRRLAAVGAGLGALDPSLEGDDLAERARAMVDEAVGQSRSKVRFVRDILPNVLERMGTDTAFIPSPWAKLNEKIGGFRPGAVYVVAARPGQGKSVIAGQIAACLAEHGNVAFSSLEMTEDELVSRFISERLQIGVGKVKDARMNDRDWDVLKDGRDRLDGLRIAIDDRSGLSAADVRGFARSVQREGHLSGVVVDYMQLMVSKQRMDRHLQVADFSRQLKIMAKEMQVPVISLSQLNRNSETSTLSVPKISDLRESGSIEQDADVVLLLRREGTYPNESLIVDVAKNRHGETGEFSLAWQGMFSRAVDWAS